MHAVRLIATDGAELVFVVGVQLEGDFNPVIDVLVLDVNDFLAAVVAAHHRVVADLDLVLRRVDGVNILGINDLADLRDVFVTARFVLRAALVAVAVAVSVHMGLLKLFHVVLFVQGTPAVVAPILDPAVVERHMRAPAGVHGPSDGVYFAVGENLMRMRADLFVAARNADELAAAHILEPVRLLQGVVGIIDVVVVVIAAIRAAQIDLCCNAFGKMLLIVHSDAGKVYRIAVRVNLDILVPAFVVGVAKAAVFMPAAGADAVFIVGVLHGLAVCLYLRLVYLLPANRALRIVGGFGIVQVVFGIQIDVVFPFVPAVRVVGIGQHMFVVGGVGVVANYTAAIRVQFVRFRLARDFPGGIIDDAVADGADVIGNHQFYVGMRIFVEIIPVVDLLFLGLRVRVRTGEAAVRADIGVVSGGLVVVRRSIDRAVLLDRLAHGRAALCTYIRYGENLRDLVHGCVALDGRILVANHLAGRILARLMVFRVGLALAGERLLQRRVALAADHGHFFDLGRHVLRGVALNGLVEVVYHLDGLFAQFFGMGAVFVAHAGGGDLGFGQRGGAAETDEQQRAHQQGQQPLLQACLHGLLLSFCIFRCAYRAILCRTIYSCVKPVSQI